MSTAPCGQVSLLSARQAMECKDIKPLAVGVTCNRPEILPRSRKWMVATWWIKFAVGMNHLKYSSLDICFWLNLFLISPSANIPSPSSPLLSFLISEEFTEKCIRSKLVWKHAGCTHSGTRLGGACGCKIFTGVFFLAIKLCLKKGAHCWKVEDIKKSRYFSGIYQTREILSEQSARQLWNWWGFSPVFWCGCDGS